MRKKAGLVFGVLLIAGNCSVANSKSIAEARNEIVSETLNYLNIPYLWGGMHPATGLDCSAFARLVYGHAGLYLPRVSKEQFAASRYLKPESVLPGDLIFFDMKTPGGRKINHVGIYVGKGFFVHASVTNGIHIDSITNPYYYKRLISLRKYSGF